MAIGVCFLPLLVSFVLFAIVFKLKIINMMIAILLGLIAVFPISIIQYFLPSIDFLQGSPILRTLIKSLILYGFVEEVIKMLFLMPIPYKKLSELEFLLLSFIMGLALGCFESMVYFLDHLQMANAKGAQLIYGSIFSRIFSSDIIHMACTGLCGLFIFSCRNKPSKISVFLTAVILHGVYDFFSGFQNNLHYFAYVVIILSLIECRNKYVDVQNLCENRLTIFY